MSSLRRQLYLLCKDYVIATEMERERGNFVSAESVDNAEQALCNFFYPIPGFVEGMNISGHVEHTCSCGDPGDCLNCNE